MIFDVITYEDTFKNNLVFSSSVYKTIAKFTCLLNFILNLLSLVFFVKDIDENGYGFTDKYFDEDHMVIRVIGAVHIILHIIKMVIWIVYIGRIETMKQWRVIFEQIARRIKADPKLLEMIENREDLGLADKNYIDLSYNDRVKLLVIHSNINNLDMTIPIIDYFFYEINFIIQNP